MSTSNNQFTSPDSILLMQAMDASPHGFAIEQADEVGTWRLACANAAFARLTRTPRDQLKNVPAATLLPWWPALNAPAEVGANASPHSQPSSHTQPSPPTMLTVQTDAGPRQIEARVVVLAATANESANGPANDSSHSPFSLQPASFTSSPFLQSDTSSAAFAFTPSPARRTITLTEVTDQVAREAKDRLIEMHGLLTAVYEAVPAGLCLVGAGNTIELCNEVFARLFASSLEDISEQPVTNFVPAKLWARACTTPAGSTPAHGFCLDRNGREFPIEAIVSPLDAGDTSWRLLTVQDLTERRRTEIRLQEARQLEGLATLAGGVAHDFNNSLAIILGYGALLQDFIGEPLQLKHAADHIVTAARRGADVVRQLQVFANAHECSPTPHDLHDLVGEAITSATSDWPVSVRLQVILNAPSTLLPLDAPQVILAIQHLLQNARDALPDNAGDIVVRTSLIDGATSPMLALTVEDNGTGMDEATRARVFEPFFAKDRGPQVRGLGLAVVYGITKAHGGRVEVDSSPRGGTRVRLLFACPSLLADEPIAPAHAYSNSHTRGSVITGVNAHAGSGVNGSPSTFSSSTSASAAFTTNSSSPPASYSGHTADSPTSPNNSRPRTILLVEDEPGIGLLWSRLLERQGWHVRWAETARDALLIFEEHRDDIALLFTDVGLPDEDGIQLALRIRTLAPCLPVLLTSGAFKAGVRENTPLAEPVGYLPKPCEFAQFEAEVSALALQAPPAKNPQFDGI